MANEALTRDLLRWIAASPRDYGETMSAWRTSCPRLSIWEDAIEAGLLRLERSGAPARMTVALTARGWAAEVERLPRPDVLAVVRPVRGCPDTTLAALASAVLRRSTNRRRFTGAEVPDDVLRRLTEIAEREDAHHHERHHHHRGEDGPADAQLGKSHGKLRGGWTALTCVPVD